jgi:hypothetical protein
MRHLYLESLEDCTLSIVKRELRRNEVADRFKALLAAR